MENSNLEPNRYYVIDESGHELLDTDDIFRGLEMIKRVGKPNYRLMRRADKKTLAYTTSPKFFEGSPSY